MLKIRRATRDDCEGIARVHVQAWEESYRGVLPDRALEPYDFERRFAEWSEILAEDASIAYVACDGECIVGFAYALENHDEPGYDALLSTLYVLAAYHRRGIAVRLLEALDAALREYGLDGMWLLTLRDRNPARGFYEHLGAIRIREQSAPAVLGEGVMDVVYGLAGVSRRRSGS